MLGACFILGLIVGIRHGDSLLMRLIYGVGLAAPALLIVEMFSQLVPKRAAAMVIAGLAALGAYKAGTDPIERRAPSLCIDVDRWGRERCE